MKKILSKNKAARSALCLLLSLCMVSASFMYVPHMHEVSAETKASSGYAAENGDNVVYVGEGRETADLSAAISKAEEGIRNIVVVTSEISLGSMTSNMYSFGSKEALSGKETVIITSYYNGVDYRASGARILMCEGSSAGRYVARCDLEFGYIEMYHQSKNDIFACMSKNVSFADGFKNSFSADDASYRPIIITGYDKQLTASSSFSGTQTVAVNDGEWQYIRGGDRRFTTNHGFTDNSGHTNIIINGGHFIASSESSTIAGAVSAHAQAATTDDASVYMEINGGVFEGPVYAYGYANSFSTKPHIGADVTIRIMGGSFKNGKVAALQCTDTSNSYYTEPAGEYVLIVEGGEFEHPSFVGMGDGSCAYYDSGAFDGSLFTSFSNVSPLYSSIVLDSPCAASDVERITLDGDDVTARAVITDKEIILQVSSLKTEKQTLIIEQKTSCSTVKHKYSVQKGVLLDDYSVDSENGHFYIKSGSDAVCLNCGYKTAVSTCASCEYEYFYNAPTKQCYRKCKNCHSVAKEIPADENGPVVFYSGSAAEGGDGKTANTAFRMLGDAYNVLVSAGVGGTVVMCGKSAPSDTEFPDAGGKVIFTSSYNSVNYRTSKYARLQIQDRMIFHNDVEFVNFDFATTSSVKYIIMNFHDLKITNARTMENYSSGSMTATASKGRNIIIGGYMVPSGTLGSSEYDNMNVDQTIYISGGVWLGIRGGNHRTASNSAFGKVSGRIDITLKGGTYNNSADSTTTLAEMGIEAAGQSKIIAPYISSITIEGGTYKNIDIFGQARKGASYYTPNNEGNMKVVINGGSFTGCGIYSYNKDSGTAAPSGEFIVEIKKQKTFTAVDGEMGSFKSAYKNDPSEPDMYRCGVSEIRATKTILSATKYTNFDTAVLKDTLPMFEYLGAAVRTESSQGQGVRVKFSADRLYTDNGALGCDVVGFGMLVRRADDGSVVFRDTDDTTRKIVNVWAYKDDALAKLYSVDDERFVFTSVMIGITEDAYEDEFEYTAYAVLRDADGNEYIVYSESVVVSAYSTAVKIEESGDAMPDFVRHILNTVRS